MPFVMNWPCARCHKDVNITLASVAEATALEQHQRSLNDTIKKLQDFIATLDAKKLPAFFAVAGGKIVAHDVLCDGEEAKRSCARRVTELISSAESLGERKPRSPKVKSTKP